MRTRFGGGFGIGFKGGRGSGGRDRRTWVRPRPKKAARASAGGTAFKNIFGLGRGHGRLCEKGVKTPADNLGDGGRGLVASRTLTPLVHRGGAGGFQGKGGGGDGARAEHRALRGARRIQGRAREERKDYEAAGNPLLAAPAWKSLFIWE